MAHEQTMHLADYLGGSAIEAGTRRVHEVMEACADLA